FVLPIPPITPAYTDVNGAATFYDVTPWTIRRWIKIGDLPATRLPGGHLRIRLSDLDALGTPVQVGA
ncbi:helix-turn-helix domain-containing protein, partial [Mycobacteroides abscessus]|uniref:helix-turn-helix domain-containing protein n=1 Tax=Mycobacteroides abscessus TaxID=36809 RepID=UPI001F220602